MPKARSKNLLVLAIACTAITTALGAAWGVSTRYYAGRLYDNVGDSGIAGVLLGHGTVTVISSTADANEDRMWYAWWMFQPTDGSVRWLPNTRIEQRRSMVSIPLWIPTGLAFAATIAAWHFELRSRRRARAGLCPTCRHDLAATPTGAPCPECGTPTSTAPPTPAP